MDNSLDTTIPKVESAADFRKNMATVARGGGVIFSGKLFLAATRFVTAFLLARLMGAQEYGSYSLALSATNIGVGLALLGLDAALIRYVAILLGRRDHNSLWGTMQAGIGIAMLLSTISGA